MSIWSELDGSVTFHEKDHVSIEKCFKNVILDEFGYDCIFSLTQTPSKRNDLVTYYFRVAVDTDIRDLSDMLKSVDANIRRKYPKYFRMDINIQTRLVV